MRHALLVTRICDAIEAAKRPLTCREIAEAVKSDFRTVSVMIANHRKWGAKLEKRPLRIAEYGKCFTYDTKTELDAVKAVTDAPTDDRKRLSAEADAHIAKWMPDLIRLKGNPFATAALQVGGGL